MLAYFTASVKAIAELNKRSIAAGSTIDGRRSGLDHRLRQHRFELPG
jgi:hypothetical protein